MSETLSQLPAGTIGALSDIIPLTQGSTAPGTGASRKMTTGKVLGSNGLVYAGDPAYGVTANGTTDDTAAWAAAFAVAASRGSDVIAPVGISIFTNLTVPSNVRIVGRNVHSYTGTTATLGTILQSVGGGSLPAITMSSFSGLQDVMVLGTSSQSCINATAGQAALVNCDIYGGRYGVDFAIQGASQPSAGGGSGSFISNCRIHDISVVGVNSPINVQIIGSTFTSCVTPILLNSGCNLNKILGNTFSLSTNYHISVASSTNVISSNSFSQSTQNAIYLNGARYTSVTGNSIGMGGAGQSASAGNASDSNFYIANCTGVTITGNVSWVGTPTTSYVCPYYAVYDGGSNVSCIISANVLGYHNNSSASTSGPINTTANFNLASSLNQSLWAASA